MSTSLRRKPLSDLRPKGGGGPIDVGQKVADQLVKPLSGAKEDDKTQELEKGRLFRHSASYGNLEKIIQSGYIKPSLDPSRAKYGFGVYLTDPGVVVDHDQVPNSIAFGAVPEDYNQMEIALVPKEIRMKPKYAGYYFIFENEMIEKEKLQKIKK